jgi:multicomponent Na+:H+ antiporter subunit E
MRFLYTFSALFLFWLALSGQFSALFLVSGAAAALLVAALAVRDDALPGPAFMVRLAAYLPWLFWQIILSSLDVAYRVLHPARPISPRLLRIKNPCRTPLGTALLANSITLTPGTVTLDAGAEELLVHSVSEEAAAALQAGEMQARVLRVEGGGRV